jgi:glucokinase
VSLDRVALGELNEYLVLHYVRVRSRATRQAVSQDLGLSPASVSRIVARLLERGLLREDGERAGPTGRPATVLSYNARTGAVIGIDLGGTKCRGALADLAGETITDCETAVVESGGGFEALRLVWDKLLTHAHGIELPIHALAVGVPAVVDPDTGRAVRGPNIDWHDFDISGRLDQLTSGVLSQEVVLVENDVNLAALGEAWRGMASENTNFAILSVGTGLGGAIVCDGHLIKGRHNGAGEFSTLLFDRAQLPHRHVDGVGGLESVVTGPAMASRAQALAAEHPQAFEEFGGTPSPVEIFRAAQLGGGYARRVIDEVIDGLAICVISICAVTDPELVVLAGSVGHALEPYLDRLNERIACHVPSPPQLAVSRLGPHSTVAGAIVAGLRLAHTIDSPKLLEYLVTKGDTRHD